MRDRESGPRATLVGPSCLLRNVMSFQLPDPDEALREAEQRDLEAERKAERSEEREHGDESPEPDATNDQGEKA
jgi:hypothetical protein